MKLAFQFFHVFFWVVLGFGNAQAETVVATHIIRAQSVLSSQDLMIKPNTILGAYSKIEELLGLETRVALYPGRPIRLGDVGPPALVERNQVVLLLYDQGGVQISTEGRALMRGSAGDLIRVMNLMSRSTVYGEVLQNGNISVSQ